MLISKFDNNESNINVKQLENMYDMALPDEYKSLSCAGHRRHKPE